VNPKNGANIENEPIAVVNTENGGITDNACTPAQIHKMGLDSQTELREEITCLRRMASILAHKAGDALSQREEYGPKDFDSYIGTWAKIAGMQAKVDGGGDGIERLIGDLAEGDDNPDGI